MACTGAVEGMQIDDDEENFFCEPCVIAKQNRPAHPKRKRNPEAGEFVHTNLSSGFETHSLGGALHVVLFKDDATRYRTVEFLSCKSEVQKTIKNYVRQVERQTGRKLRTIRSDNGGEYIAKVVKNFVENEGINHQWSSAYVPQQNSRAEREMRTIIERARSMLKACDLPNVLWAEAVATAVYVLNRTVNRQRDDGKTQFEAWFEFKPSIAHLRPFGCDAYLMIPGSKRQKLDAKSRRVTFVGYSETEKNFRVFDREKRKVVVSCNIKFNETKMTPIVNEFYCEQEIGSGYGSQSYVEFVPLSRPAEIQEDDSESDSKVNEGQEAQNSRDKKSGTVETPRRSQRERTQPDWLSYSSIAEFAYSAVVGSPLTFDEAVESSDRKKWRVSMDEKTMHIIETRPESWYRDQSQSL